MRKRVVALKSAALMLCTPVLGANYSDYQNSFSSAYLLNDSGTPISSFTTTWTVPIPPNNQSSQSIAIWSGLQPADSSAVLQPVLQWGNWANGGDKSWAVSCWAVTIDSKGKVENSASKPIPVATGDILRAVIELESVDSGTYSYKCYFDGFPESEVQLQTRSELIGALEVVETYNVSQCSDYPGRTVFKDISIKVVGDSKNMKWHLNPNNREPLDCGLKVEIIKDSAQEGWLSIGI